MRLALLTDPRYERPARVDAYIANILEEDRLVAEAFARRDVQVERVAWSREEVAWERFDGAVFRTTWDYFEWLPAFLAWLDRVEPVLPLVNPASTIRWNLDKTYLLDLDGWGVPIVPTHHEPAGGNPDLAGLLADRGWTEAVIKPAVSGAARNTYRVTAADGARWAALVADEAMLLQPFQASILTEGEVTLMLFGGVYSHAVRKRARPGDFRVQDDHGGTVHPFTPDDGMIALAERTLSMITPTPAYGRVDLVLGAEGPRVMEVELIEPELWFRTHPPAAEAFAEAVLAVLG